MATLLETIQGTGNPNDLSRRMLQSGVKPNATAIPPVPEGQLNQQPQNDLSELEAIFSGAQPAQPESQPMPEQSSVAELEEIFAREPKSELPAQGFDLGAQERTEQQASRLSQLQRERYTKAQSRRESRILRSNLTPDQVELEEIEPGREELLLERNIDVDGPAFNGAQFRGGFGSSPVMAFQQALAETYPDAAQQGFNFDIKFVPVRDDEEVSGQTEAALKRAEEQANFYIAKMQREGQPLTDTEKLLVQQNFAGREMANMEGLELVYRNPETGRYTAANPAGFNAGDVFQYTGPLIEEGLELAGGIGGAILGAPLGIVPFSIAAGVGAGVGRGAGVAINRVIADAFDVEPDYFSASKDVVQKGKDAAMFNAIAGGAGRLLARKLAKMGTEGANMVWLQLSRFLDTEEFAKNKAAVDKMNQVLAKRGMQEKIKPTMSQLSNSRYLATREREVYDISPELMDLEEKRGLLLDTLSNYMDDTGAIMRETKLDWQQNFKDELSQMVYAKQQELQRPLKQAELDEQASILNDVINQGFRLGSEAIEANRPVYRDALDSFKKQYSERYTEQDEILKQADKDFRKDALKERRALMQEDPEAAAMVQTDPVQTAEFARVGKEMKREQRKQVLELDQELDGYLASMAARSDRYVKVDEATGQTTVTPKFFTLEGVNNTVKMLKNKERQVDNGILTGLDAVSVKRASSALQKDFFDSIDNASAKGYLPEGFADDVRLLNAEYRDFKSQSELAFGKLLQQKDGNYKVRDLEAFDKFLLNDPETAKAISRFVDYAGMPEQLSLIKEGVRDSYLRKIYGNDQSTWGEPLTKGQRKRATEWINDPNISRSLELYFTPQEIAQLKNPLQLAKQKVQAEKDYKEAEKLFEQQFLFKLSNASPEEITQKLWSKPWSEIEPIWNKLPKTNQEQMRGLIQKEFLAGLRVDPSTGEINVKNMFKQLGIAKNPTMAEEMGRLKAEKILGKDYVQDMEDIAEGLNVVARKIAPLGAEDPGTRFRSKMFDAAKLVLFGYLNPRAAKLKAGQFIITEGRARALSKALADPDAMIAFNEAVKKVSTAKNQAAIYAGMSEVLNALGMKDLVAASAPALFPEEEANKQ